MKRGTENEYGNTCGGYYCSEEHGHIDCGPNNVNTIGTARSAILEDLRQRAKAGDKSVQPNKPDHHWYQPQPNYYSGAGIIPCPVCKTGNLRYSRSSYNGHVHAMCNNPGGCVGWME